MQAEVVHHFASMPAVAAHVKESSAIDAYLDEPSVLSVEADCVVQLDDEMTIDKHAAAYTVKTNVTNGDSVQDFVTRMDDAPWGLDRIDSRSGLDGAYEYGTATGASSRLYILDTGVRISHNDFGGRAVAGWSSGCPTGSESGCGSSWMRDGVISGDRPSCSGHGTHCASTAAGTTYGVAKEAKIITVQVLSCQGSGCAHAFASTCTGAATVAMPARRARPMRVQPAHTAACAVLAVILLSHSSYSGIISGIEWAVADAANHPNERAVISMSLGGRGRSNVIFRAVKAAHEANVLVVAAAGNSQMNACDYSPAGAPEALTVGSTTSGDALSHFSNHGPCVDIQAPGSAIVRVWPLSTARTHPHTLHSQPPLPVHTPPGSLH